jgi:hypothetical protein
MQPTPQEKLMSKHRVLCFKPQLRLEWRGQDGQNETEQPDHSANLGDSITASTQMRFSVHTGLCRSCAAAPNPNARSSACNRVRVSEAQRIRLSERARYGGRSGTCASLASCSPERQGDRARTPARLAQPTDSRVAHSQRSERYPLAPRVAAKTMRPREGGPARYKTPPRSRLRRSTDRTLLTFSRGSGAFLRPIGGSFPGY